MRIDKSESRRRWREMTEMVNGWDPIGLIEMGAPLDEYDCVVGDVMRALERKDSPEQLATFLAAHIAEHFGLAPSDPRPFAEQAVAWYTSRWPESHV
jgi:hypothetical protein